MIGDVLRRNPRVRLVAASLAFLYLSCAAAGFLGVFVGPGLVADWSAEPTSVPDNASVSGFSIVTYRAGVEIARRPATVADLQERRSRERFLGKWGTLFFGLVLEGLLLWAAWKASGWVSDDASPRSWRVGVAVVFLGMGATFVSWSVLVYGGVAQSALLDEQKGSLLALSLLFAAVWTGGGLRILMFPHRPPEAGVVRDVRQPDGTWRIGGMEVGLSKPAAIFWLIVVIIVGVYTALEVLKH